MSSKRLDRMLKTVPYYYKQSNLYNQIQNTVAEDLEQVSIDNEDLRKQLTVTTATWGLKYWEEAVGIPVRPEQAIPIRRGKVISKLRSTGNFSAELLISVIEAFTDGTGEVELNIPDYSLYLNVVNNTTIIKLADIAEAMEQIIHAHIGWDLGIKNKSIIDPGLTIIRSKLVDLPFAATDIYCGTVNMKANSNLSTTSLNVNSVEDIGTADIKITGTVNMSTILNADPSDLEVTEFDKSYTAKVIYCGTSTARG